jgi:hypothetical protein
MHIKKPSMSVELFHICLLKVYLLWITSIWAMLGKPSIILSCVYFMVCLECHPIAGVPASFCISCYRMCFIFLTPCDICIPKPSFIHSNFVSQADPIPLTMSLELSMHLPTGSTTSVNLAALQILNPRNRMFTSKPDLKAGSSSASQYSILISGKIYQMVR